MAKENSDDHWANDFRIGAAQAAQLPQQNGQDQKVHGDRHAEPLIEIPMAAVRSHYGEAKGPHRREKRFFLRTAGRFYWRPGHGVAKSAKGLKSGCCSQPDPRFHGGSSKAGSFCEIAGAARKAIRLRRISRILNVRYPSVPLKGG